MMMIQDFPPHFSPHEPSETEEPLLQDGLSSLSKEASLEEISGVLQPSLVAPVTEEDQAATLLWLGQQQLMQGHDTSFTHASSDTVTLSVSALSELDTLRVRQRVLKLIQEIESLRGYQARFERARKIKTLHQLGSQVALCKVLLQAFKKATSHEAHQLLSEMMLEVGTLELLQEPLWAFIKDPQPTDEVKDCANLILRHLGDESSSEAYMVYLADPNNLVYRETERMLRQASENPEALVDFIDFLVTLAPDEQVELLDTILENKEATRQYANAMAQVLCALIDYYPQGPITDYCLKALTHFPSYSLGMWLSRTQETLSARSELLTRYLKQLQAKVQLGGFASKGGSYEEESNLQAWHTMVQCSLPTVCYMTLPDGEGDQALLMVRQYHLEPENASVPEKARAQRLLGEATTYANVLSVAFNTEQGIIDCFGIYELSEEELENVYERFQSANQRFAVPAEIGAYFIRSAEYASRAQQKPIPYEFSAWQVLLQDLVEQPLDMPQDIPCPIQDRTLMERVFFEFLEEQQDLQHWHWSASARLSLRPPHFAQHPQQVALWDETQKQHWLMQMPQAMSELLRLLPESQPKWSLFLRDSLSRLASELALDARWRLLLTQNIGKTIALLDNADAGQSGYSPVAILIVRTLLLEAFHALKQELAPSNTEALEQAFQTLLTLPALRWMPQKHVLDRVYDTVESLSSDPLQEPDYPSEMAQKTAKKYPAYLTPEQVEALDLILHAVQIAWKYPLPLPTFTMQTKAEALKEKASRKENIRLLSRPVSAQIPAHEQVVASSDEALPQAQMLQDEASHAMAGVTDADSTSDT
ncbi:MAG: hypothetical protein ACKO37_05670 [Vampirovibrionales bacterium]